MRTLMRLVLGIGFGLWLRDLLRRPRSRVSVAAAAEPDVLTMITGIGPVFANALQELGIYTFAQLAHEDADSLSRRMSAPVTAERIRRERWIEQAKEQSGA